MALDQALCKLASSWGNPVWTPWCPSIYPSWRWLRCWWRRAALCVGVQVFVLFLQEKINPELTEDADECIARSLQIQGSGLLRRKVASPEQDAESCSSVDDRDAFCLPDQQQCSAAAGCLLSLSFAIPAPLWVRLFSAARVENIPGLAQTLQNPCRNTALQSVWRG